MHVSIVNGVETVCYSPYGRLVICEHVSIHVEGKIHEEMAGYQDAKENNVVSDTQLFSVVENDAPQKDYGYPVRNLRRIDAQKKKNRKDK